MMSIPLIDPYRPEHPPQTLEFENDSGQALQARYLALVDDLLTAGMSMNTDQLLSRVADRLGEMVGADGCHISLWDESGQHAYPYTAVSQGSEHDADLSIFTGETHLTEKVLQAGRPLVIENLQEVPFPPPEAMTISPAASALVLPMQNGEEKLGAITIYFHRLYAFSPAEIRLYEQAAQLISLALFKERLFAATSRQVEELRVLRDVALVGAQAGGEDILLERATQIIGDLFYPDNFGIILLHEDHQELIAHASYRGSSVKDYDPVPLSVGIIGYVARTGRSLIVPDVSKNSLYLAADERTRSELCVPLMADAQLLGVVNAESSRLNAFNAADERLLITLSSQLATALQKIRLLEAEQQRRAEAETMREAARRYAVELETLFAISTALRQVSTVEAMIPIILQQSKESLQAVMAVLGLLDESGEAVVLRGMLPVGPVFKERSYRIDEGIIGRVAQSYATYTTDDLHHDPLAVFYASDQDYLRQIGCRSLISVPLRTSQKMLGVLNVLLGADSPITGEKVQLIEAIAEIAAGALQRALIMSTLEQRVAERTRELAAANERLQELDRLKTKFISDVSHELRTPITNLGLYLDLIERGRPEKQEHYWQILRQQMDRLKFLIEDVLRLTRLGINREELALQPVDLNTIVAEDMAEYLESAGKKELLLQFLPAADLPLLNGEPHYLQQVVANIVVNAINYTPAGKVIISTAYDADLHQIVLRVADTGPGIAPEDRPHIFERFYRGWNLSATRTPGTGLGLSLVQEIVHLHEGQVSVESEPDRGATFIVRLPAG